MQRFTSHLRRPVRHSGAEQYLLVTLLSFAASVTLTRLFLELTGYPQLGGGDLHIAHALWGGLLLYLASLLPLIFANRWVYLASASLAGFGVGLFIDEVGKFITQSNDYFYPLAAPIVYAFFLFTVMLYQRVRRPSRSVRAELYGAFDAMEEVLEQDLDPQERDHLAERLRYVRQRADRPELTRLADALLDFLHCEQLALAPRRPGRLERARQRWQALEQRWLTRQRVRLLLAAGLAGLGVVMLLNTALIAAVSAWLASARGLPPSASTTALSEFLQAAQASFLTGLFRYTDLVLETLVSLLLIMAAALLLAGKDALGTAFGSLGLLLSLTAVNLLVFYYDQFSGILTASAQLILLSATLYYRHHYLYGGAETKPADPSARTPPPPTGSGHRSG